MSDQTILETVWNGNPVVHNRYEIDDTPLQGGFAYVFRAYDTKMGRYVALKCLKANRLGTQRWLEHFRREGKMLASVSSHPNVVQVYDVDTDPETEVDYFTMEWVDGDNLDQWRLKQPVFDMDTLLGISIGICRGLEAIHDANLIHGDITMKNVLLANTTGQIIPKLTDFGLAWNVEAGVPDFVGGTRLYLSPEQFDGKSWDKRADIYSLGAVLFYLFSGEYYLSSLESTENQYMDNDRIKYAICNEQPRTLHSVHGTGDTNLSDLLLRMLEKDPKDRPQYASEVRMFLEEIERTYQKPKSQGFPTQQATGSIVLGTEETVRTVTIAPYITKSAANAAREHIKPRLVEFKGQDSWRWNKDDDLIEEILRIKAEYDCYIYNEGDGRETGQHDFRIIFATDTDNENNLTLLEALDKTLILFCVHRPGKTGLLIKNISKASVDTGQRNSTCLHICARFIPESANHSSGYDLPPDLVSDIKKLPQKIQPDPEIRKRLEHWKTYLNIWERLVQEKTYEVEYVGWRPDQRQNSSLSRIRFYLSPEAEAVWDRIRASRNDRIHLRLAEDETQTSEPTSSEDSEPTYMELGVIQQVNDKERYLTVDLDPDSRTRFLDENGSLDVPSKGYLAYRAGGDMAQIRKQRRAFEDLELGKAANPRLGQFIFDATQAVFPENDRVTLRSEEFLLPNLNEAQRACVESALASPDLYLIWGPPGTGKTTVIAELCYQFVQRGERVLVASQANLAVDNALSKLVHHPSIVALRVGKADRVEQEGLPFTENNVVATWFENTAKDVERRLGRIEDDYDRFEALIEADFVRLQHYLTLVEESAALIPSLEATCNALSGQLAKDQEACRTQISDRESLTQLRSTLKNAEQSLRTGSLQEHERLRAWQSNAVNLIATSEYQQYLENVARGIGILEVAKPNIAEQMLQETLNKDDRAMLRSIRDGVSEAGRYSHRVTAMLMLGSQIRQDVAEQAKSLQPYLDKLSSFLKLGTERRQEIDRIKFADKFLNAKATLTRLHGLNSAYRQLVKYYRLFLDNYEQSKQQQQDIDTVTRHLNNAVSQLPPLEMAVRLRPEIEGLQLQIDERLKELADEVPHLEKARSRVLTLSEQVRGRSFIVKQLEMEVEEQEDIIDECKAFVSSFDRLAHRIVAWLDNSLAEPDFPIPSIIAKQLKEQSQVLRSSNSVIKVYEEILVVVRKALRQYQSTNPTSQQAIQDDTSGSSFRTSLAKLFIKDSANNQLWLPTDESTVVTQVGTIFETHLRDADRFKGILRLKDKSGPVPTSVYHSARKFEKFVEEQIDLRRNRVDDSRIRSLLEEIIEVEKQKREVLHLRLQKAIEEENHNRQSKVGEAQNLLEGFVGQALSHLQAIKPLCAQIDNSLGCEFYGTILTQLSASEKTDFAQLASDLITSADKLNRYLSTCAKKLKEKQVEVQTLQDKQQTLEKNLSITVQAVEELWGNVNGFAERITRDYQELAGEIGQESQKLGLAVEGILTDIQARRECNQSSFVAVITELLGKQEDLCRSAQSTLAEWIGTRKLSDSIVDEYRTQRLQRQKEIETQIETSAPELVTIAARFGMDISLPSRKSHEFDLEAFSAFRDHLKRIVNSGRTLKTALDPYVLLDRLHSIIDSAEKTIDNQIGIYEASVDNLSRELKLKNKELNKAQNRLADEKSWWDQTFSAIPDRLTKALDCPSSIHEPQFIHTILDALDSPAWKSEVGRQRNLLKPSKAMLTDWLARLRAKDPQDVKDLKGIYIENANVVGVTCGQVNRINYLQGRRDLRPFDAVIVDEVSKATPPELLLPLLKGKRVILVGDHKQLPPMIEAQTLRDIAEEHGVDRAEVAHIERSLFESLYNFAPQVFKGMLTEQYRMHHSIMDAINQFYDRRLSGGHQRSHGLSIPAISPDTSIAWIATPRDEPYFEDRVHTTYLNHSEVEIVGRLLDQMNEAWLPNYVSGKPHTRKEVGLITFYMGQLTEFRERFSQPNRYPALNIRIGTVDRFQGMERQVVIVSLVRNNTEGTIGFAKEPERINVAFSRAQELLVVVGSKSLFAQEAKRAGDATESYKQIAYVVEHEGRMIDVSEFQQYR